MNRGVLHRGLIAVALAAMAAAACSDDERMILPPVGVWSYHFEVIDGGATCSILNGFLLLDGATQTLTGFADGLLTCTVPGTLFEGGVSSSYGAMTLEGSVAGGVIMLQGYFGAIMTLTHEGDYTGDRMQGDVTVAFEDGSSVVVRGTWRADRDPISDLAYERMQGFWAAVDCPGFSYLVASRP